MRLNACTHTYIHYCFNGADSKGINRLRFSDWLLILLHYNILPESVLLGHLSSKTHPKSHCAITEAVKRGYSDSEIKTKSTKALSRREEGEKTQPDWSEARISWLPRGWEVNRPLSARRSRVFRFPFNLLLFTSMNIIGFSPRLAIWSRVNTLKLRNLRIMDVILQKRKEKSFAELPTAGGPRVICGRPIGAVDY